MRARRRTLSPRREPPAARGFWSETMAIVLMALALLLVLSLGSYHADDPVPWPLGQWRNEPVRNVVGITGALFSEMLLQLLGYAAWAVPPLMLLLGWETFWRRSGRTVSRILGSMLLVLSAAACLDLVSDGGSGPDIRSPGGWFGSAFAHLLARPLGRWGAPVVAAALVATSLLVVTRASIIEAARIVWARVMALLHSLWLAWVRQREARRKERLRLEVARRQKERRAAAAALEAEIGPAVEPHAAAPIPLVPMEGAPPAPAEGRAAAAAAATAARKAARAAGKGRAEPQEGQPQFDFAETPIAYTPPPLSLLNPPQHDVQVDEKELVETARIITEKCREFDVTGQVIAIQPGPVVTVFEFKPDAGVKYSKIVTLADDLCLAIEAESIRIDRIAGKSTVGIEVPNKKRETISLRELLASERFQKASAPLTLALGKEINGEPYYADLARMPHLLVAGSTGSGKSVSLNTFLTSILYKSSPDEVKFIMIDPKRLELGVYENIPHLLTPLVTDTKKAANALRWAVLEMERRYKQLAEAGVRGIDQYNLIARREIQERGAKETRAVPEGAPPETDGGAAEGAAGAPAPAAPSRAAAIGAEPVKPLPYVVIVIDELADLMMTTGAEVEEAITRLAQMARAVGIHLILSTQRPSVDIITGVIKANFPCRIAMRVSSKVDSRTILDSNGAEHLLGHGDMLFIPPGSSRLIRLHGPLVTEVEATRIVSFLKKQAKPQYDESVTRDEPQGGPGAGAGRDEEVDPAYDQAVRLAIQMGQISVSHIQRRLKLGYARAARLVDMMEQNGIVGPADGSKPREVLVEPEFLERMSQMREEQT